MKENRLFFIKAKRIIKIASVGYNSISMKKKISLITIFILSTMIALTGCTSEASVISNAQDYPDGKEVSNHYYLPVGTYDSADTAILQKINTEDSTITLYNTYAAKTYTLNYDGTTYVSDKYGTPMSMTQLVEGTIVNVNFLKSSKQLVDIQVSPDAWTYDNIDNYDLGGINQTASIGDRTYALTKGVQVFSQGETSDIMSIVKGDIISVSGIGYDIYSIRVETGHGYVRLTNDEDLIGGWIELGNTLISQVSEDMLMAVPEGTYTVRMYNNNSEMTQDIIVERNKEVVLDCSDIVAPEEIYGSILFHITPENASLYLDGTYKDHSSVVKTTFGVHQIEVEAVGYDTLSKYINVGTNLADITIVLEESHELIVSGNSSYEVPYDPSIFSTSANASGANSATGNSASNNGSVSGNNISGNKSTSTSTTKRVYVYSPDNVEVYVDGVYAGLSPMNFKKVPGTHTITLKKPGYVTRSYTIYLYDDGDDVNISFSQLEKDGSNSDSVSDNNSGSN